MTCKLVENLTDKYEIGGGFVLYKDIEKNSPTKFHLGVISGVVVIDELPLSEKDFDYIKRREGINKCRGLSKLTPP